MIQEIEEQWQYRVEVYALLANSLLAPMSAEFSAGLDPVFWRYLPIMGCNEHIDNGLAQLSSAALSVSGLEKDDAITKVAAEHAKLFVGVGTPDAPPWETLYKGDTNVLFGQPTFDMKCPQMLVFSYEELSPKAISA